MIANAMLYTYIPRIMKIGSGIQKLIGGGGIHTPRVRCSYMPSFIFYKGRKLG
jgi:hypothetical protein